MSKHDNDDFPAAGPMSYAVMTERRPPAGDGQAAQYQPPRVLHVDGDGDTALVLATLLVPETQVTHVHTLAAAQRALAHGQFALVVLDPDLPDGDGAALIAMLKLAAAPTPVLLYSARYPAERDQAHAFLPKPWTSPRQLWRTVSQMLGLTAETTSGSAA